MAQNDRRIKKVLLVEDNDFDELLTRRALAKLEAAYELVVAKDGKEALEFLFELELAGKLPDMVILDLKLPRIGGFEVLKKIRSTETTRQLPVFVVTASDEDQDVSAARQLGATSYNSKPVDALSYSSLIQKLVTAF